MKEIVIEESPPGGSNFSLVNKEAGLVRLRTHLFEDPIQIGEAKRILYLMITSLDKAAKTWKVANNLDENRKSRRLVKKTVLI